MLLHCVKLHPLWRCALLPLPLPRSYGSPLLGAGPVCSTLAGAAEAAAEEEKGDAASLLSLVRARRVDAVARLLAAGASPDLPRDSRGTTPLMWAADGGDLALVRLLLNAGADVGARDDEGSTALAHATACDYPLVAQALLEAGADAGSMEGPPDAWLPWWPHPSQATRNIYE